MTYDVEIGKRIALIRQRLGMTPTAFGRKARISHATINEVEEGRKGAGTRTLVAIAETYSISLNWLVLGLGPTYIKDTVPVEGSEQVLDMANLPPCGEAEGLASIMKNPDLVRKIGLTKDDVDWLTTWLRRSPADLKNMPPEWFLMSLQSHRKAQLDAIQEAIKDYLNTKS